MKVDFTSALWITLVMAMLKTVTVVFGQLPQRCGQLNATCSGQKMLRVVATGENENETLITCTPDTTETSDTFVWYFDNTSGIHLLRDGNKHMITDNGRNLFVRDTNITDEGRYYCQRVTSGNPQPDSKQLPGACLYVYGPAEFATCGFGREQTPQEGCGPEPEMLTATTEDESVTFDISVVHANSDNYCFLQRIQGLTFKKLNSDLMIRCNDMSCENASRFNQSRPQTPGFEINLTLHKPLENDSGMYMLTANIRDPSNNARKCLYKNFYLMVTDPTTTTENPEEPMSPSSTDNIPLEPSAVVITVSIIAVLALLLMVLIGVGVFLCLWTFHKKPKDSIYAQPKKARNGILGAADDKIDYDKRSSVVSFNEHESVMLGDSLNSPPENC